MIKMVETRTITGILGRDENWEHAKWTLEGQTTWNGVEAEVKIFLEDILGQYDGEEIVLTIAPAKNKPVDPK